MSEARQVETLGVGVIRWSDGEVSFTLSSLTEQADESKHWRRHYKRGTSEHQICDDVQRLVCGWIELGEMGLMFAYDDLRQADVY